MYYRARQYDEAIEELRKVIELYPNRPVPHLYLAWVYLQTRQYEEAIAEIQKANELWGGRAEPICRVRLCGGGQKKGNQEDA